MKKLLHIIAQRPEKTGSGTFLQEMLKEADEKNYEQAFVAALNNSEDFKFRSKNEIEFFPVYFQAEDLPFNIIGMSDNMPYESTKYSELTDEMLAKWKKAFKEVITQAVSEFKPDVIISHHLWILTAYVKELFPDITVCGICHGTDLRQLKLAPRFSNYVIKGCAKLDFIFSLNEFQKDKVIKKFSIQSCKVQIIGIGYNSSIFQFFESFKDQNSIELVYAGKISCSKGVLSLIKALGKIDVKNKKLRLTIAGSGNQGKETEEIYAAGKLCTHEVDFIGTVSQEKLASIFNKSDIFILPSFYEGLPLVLIEAMACGLRVVTTDIPGVKQWIGEEINSSGIIYYIKLPKMEKVDVPFKEELPEFENRLKASIETQIKRLSEPNFTLKESVYDSIKKMTWFDVFETIENILNKSIEESKES